MICDLRSEIVIFCAKSIWDTKSVHEHQSQENLKIPFTVDFFLWWSRLELLHPLSHEGLAAQL